MKSNTEAIRRLNDEFRTGRSGSGPTLITSGVKALGDDACTAIHLAVRQHVDFNVDNDPHEEHDFGSLNHYGHTIFWKIDYYNLDLSGGSEDPANAQLTSRVLTIMLAEEY